jgi:hypothetical protein
MTYPMVFAAAEEYEGALYLFESGDSGVRIVQFDVAAAFEIFVSEVFAMPVVVRPNQVLQRLLCPLRSAAPWRIAHINEECAA